MAAETGASGRVPVATLKQHSRATDGLWLLRSTLVAECMYTVAV